MLWMLRLAPDLQGAERGPESSFDVAARKLRRNRPAPSLHAKAAALCFSLARNHAFVDGNKRVAHAAMEVFLTLNGYEIVAPVDEQERLMLDLAAGKLTREQMTEWLEKHLQLVDRPAG